MKPWVVCVVLLSLPLTVLLLNAAPTGAFDTPHDLFSRSVPSRAPQLVHLSWAENNRCETMAAVWWTPVKVKTEMNDDTESRAWPEQCRFSASSMAYTIAPETDLDGDKVTTSFPGQFHEVNATGLDPGTLHYFRVDGPGGWSQE